ncbi:organic solvent tolerance family protein [Candidatus Endolissoclinum faulkneri L2]|uniref:LPS-assembly protein LptD n=1 Tax=Candidatus Endolissoclinum faulkneri L2 TaxID=1193729 RepID=K7YHN0_9PROT|nr:LPS assembly protein LptD [Candidatus Endolissoclinum faulkneri]AFX99090.1 organic solvent tolerance family protein [Candidatus Endolissoclinum faulkneri L2]
MTRTQIIAAILILLSVNNIVKQSKAQEANAGKKPFLLIADEIIYDESFGILTARGNVEISQNSLVLRADTISYNRKADTVIALGNVAIMQSSGQVIFSDYVELNHQLKIGTINNFRSLLVDGSRLAAVRGRRKPAYHTELEKAIFSPCSVCDKDGNKTPVWQIKALKIVHDEINKDIIYNFATFELYGFPIAFTPYFKHPDPTIKRSSGMLAPTIGLSDELGFIYGQPYYYVIDDASDLLIEPRIHSTSGSILLTNYRKQFSKGEINLDNSIAYVKQSYQNTASKDYGFEWHADWAGKIKINESWLGGFDFEQASQSSYLTHYNIKDARLLTSKLYAERFHGRNYTSLEAYKFQNLQSSIHSDDTPIILPLIQYSYVGPRDKYGGHTSLDASLLSMSKKSGKNTQRVSAVTGWELQSISDNGAIYTLNANLQTDAYYVTNAGKWLNEDKYIVGRIFPQMGLKWQYPLVKRSNQLTTLIEPIGSLFIAPLGGNPKKITNEGSQQFEFDETKLFRLNRYDDTDRVTNGSHLNYGLHAGVYGDDGSSSEILIGQSYRFYGRCSLDYGAGLEEDLSDLVGALSLRPTSWPFKLTYRFRYDPEEANLHRNEVGFYLSQPRFHFGGNYISIDSYYDNQSPISREQIELYGRLKMSDHWNIDGLLTSELSHPHNPLLRGKLGFTYTNECILFGINFQRSNISDKDIKANDRIMFRLTLTHLGEF